VNARYALIDGLKRLRADEAGTLDKQAPLKVALFTSSITSPTL
jgi:hypothetical protein